MSTSTDQATPHTPHADPAVGPGRPISYWWTFAGIAAGIVMGLAAGIIALIAVMAANPSMTYSQFMDMSVHPLVLVTTALIPLWLGLLGAVWLAARRSQVPWRQLVHFTWVPRRDIPVGIGFAAVAFVAAAAVAYVMSLVGFDTAGADNTGILTSQSSILGVIIIVLCVSVGAPVVEEIFFRGLVLRTFLTRGARPWVAIAASSLLFGAMHATGATSPSGAVVLVATTTTTGAVLAVAAWKTGRLGASIIAHGALNGFACVLALTATGAA